MSSGRRADSALWLTDAVSSEHQGQPTVASLDQLARAQRYAWAAEVCVGMTVLALDGRVEDTAALGAGARRLPSDGARRELLEDAGAVVWLDGADRASDPARILALLVELAGEGRTVVVAVPNGRAFDQRGLGAGVVYGVEDARALMARLPDGRMLSQHVLAGTMIGTGDRVLRAAVPAPIAEPDGARAWLVCANVDGTVWTPLRTRSRLVDAPYRPTWSPPSRTPTQSCAGPTVGSRASISASTIQPPPRWLASSSSAPSPRKVVCRPGASPRHRDRGGEEQRPDVSAR